ncbi:IclR family transcriptional regulator [Agromyces bauzanensis]
MATIQTQPDGQGLMDETSDPDPGKRTAAARVLALLGAFSRGGGALTLSEISRYADLSLTTTHRLAKEVLEWGGLELDDQGRYRLSRKILDLASSSTQALRLRERALPHLANLHRLTGLTVHLSVRDGRDVVYLDVLRAHANLTGESRIGGRLRLHVAATGLVLLAYADESCVDDYLQEPLKRYTPEGIGDPATLRACLAEVRRHRFAIASRFLSMRAGSVAAPISNPDGTVETALGVVYMTERDDPMKLVDLVRATANRVSHALADNKPQLDPRTIEFKRRQAGLL